MSQENERCQVCGHTEKGNDAHFDILHLPATKGSRPHKFVPPQPAPDVADDKRFSTCAEAIIHILKRDEKVVAKVIDSIRAELAQVPAPTPHRTWAEVKAEMDAIRPQKFRRYE